jgi:hypothetical protein
MVLIGAHGRAAMAGPESSMVGHGELAREGKGRREEKSRGDVLLAAGRRKGEHATPCVERKQGHHQGARSSLFVQHLPADYCLREVEERKEKEEKKKKKGKRKKTEKEKGKIFKI